MNRSRSGSVAWLLLVSVLAAPAFADEQRPSPSTPAPTDASVSLKLPESVAFGDHVQGELIIKNTGDRPLQIRHCGDFGLGPNPWVQVSVRNGKGELLPDLTGGGRLFTSQQLPTVTLGLGEAASVPWSLEPCVGMLAPGGYSVSVEAQFGWPGKEILPTIAAAANLVVKPASAQEIAAYIHTLCLRGSDADVWDLQHLTASLFLPALVAEAKAGRALACLGIGSILSEDANLALLDLALANDPAVARSAAFALRLRLPSKASDGESGRVAGSFIYPPWLVLRFWRPQFDAPLLTVAGRLLDRQQPISTSFNHTEINPILFDGFCLGMPDSISLGAQFIRARGGPEHVPALLEALQWALDHDSATRRTGVAEEAPPPFRDLLQALDALRARGWRSEEKGNAAMQLAYLRQLAEAKDPKPADGAWQQSVRTALASKSPLLRQSAVRVIPVPLTDDWLPRLRAALEDEDGGVVCAACKVAGQSGRQDLVHPLAQLITAGRDYQTQAAATAAATKLGGGMELWEALSDVLPDRELYGRALLALLRGTIDLPPLRSFGYRGADGLTRDERFLVCDAWRAFLESHRKLLEGGHRVPADDSSITSRLTGGEFGSKNFMTIELTDRTPWAPAGK